MTKSQNTKNEQQKDLCITSEQLTEQFNHGLLPDGWYYIKDENGVIYAAENCLNYDSLSDKGYTAFYYAETEISEILSPVPTYSEYLALQSDSLAKNEGAEIVAELEKRLKKTQGLELDLRRKNHELKELLKECRKILCESQTTNPLVFFRWENDLINKIDEVLL